jgi:hypothetical protein
LVFRDGWQTYTVMARDSSNPAVLEEHYFLRQTILLDVPPGQPMWAESVWHKGGSEYFCEESAAIHIHSPADLNGGGRNVMRDKSLRHESTQVVE